MSKIYIEDSAKPGNADEQRSIPSLVPVSREKEIPLSFAQQRLWMHDELEPNTPNNVNNAVRIRGGIKHDALQKALDTILERHETLRTTFSVSGGLPVQVINGARPVRTTLIDLSDSQEAERGDEIRRLMAEEARKCFDLSRDLMLRATLLRLSDIDHVLLLTIHHIASDAWSTEIFFRELLTLYGAFAEGRPSPLPDLPVQYADYACRQREWMSDGVMQDLLSYWQNRLADCPGILELPTDRPRTSVRDLHGASHTFTLPWTFVDSLRRLCEQEGVTMFVMVMAAFKTLLYRYSGQGDICVGTFTPGRDLSELKKLIGFFVNTLVLRSDLSDGPSFRELLRRESETAAGAFAHSDLPFEKLVEVLNPQRGPGFTPLFQVAMAFEDMPRIPVELPGLSFELLDSETSVSLFDLSLIITKLSGGMRMSFIYKTGLFDSCTIQRMAINFQTLLEGIVSNHEGTIFTLPVLSDPERNKVLREWNGRQCAEPSRDCIHGLFEAQVKRTPDDVALIFEGSSLTYRVLNSRANQLAHYLRRLGVGPEALVGIYEERSLEMIVGILGILKAGGAYVPLDPGYPVERLRLMMEDAGVSMLLTHARLSVQLPSYKGIAVYMDTDWPDIARESNENPGPEAAPENAACLLYTSGSTGRPKGAILQHSSLVHFTKTVITQYGLKSSDRVLQFASISFDASAEEIFPCLALGATLVIRTDEILTDSDFLQRCDEWKLTVLSLPTAYWQALTLAIEDEGLRVPDSLRLLVIGGERAFPESLVRWQRHAGTRVRILNTYGPTEATVVTTLFDLTHFNPIGEYTKELPIGRPVPGALVYILGSGLQPVPIGVSGELHIGGITLARGYLDRPEVTAGKFINDPFSNQPGTRLYKTGDMARFLPDGNIEFKGRKDHQVKIRGFRIELGEIESWLRQHPSVREAVVIVREDRPGDQRVAAYVVPNDRASIQVRDLRNFLTERLPNYMVPSAFVVLESLPLTPNRKVDRSSFPAPDKVIHASGKTFAAPRNELEIQLTKIWEEALGVRPVGVTDNFFELGGHSLLAVRLISEIRKLTRKDLPVMSIFHCPTIERLAGIILDNRPAGQWSSVIPVRTGGPKTPLFTVHDMNLARFLGPDQPLYMLTHPNKDEDLSPYDSIEKIALKNIREMRKVQPGGPYFIGGYCFWAIVALEMAHQLIKQGEEVSLLFLVEPPDNCLADRTPEDSGFKSRVMHARSKLAPLGNTEKIAFILQNMHHMIKRKTSYKRLKYMAKVITCKTYLFFGQLPPHTLRRFYLSDYFADETSKSYVPRVYPGKTIIFYADGELDGALEAWQNHVTGEVGIHQVQGAGHLDILKEHHVRTWAKLLGKYLNGSEVSRGGNQA